jgi:hypothetical protein
MSDNTGYAPASSQFYSQPHSTSYKLNGVNIYKKKSLVVLVHVPESKQ